MTFDQLYKAYYNRLMRHAKRRIFNEMDREEVVQDSFVLVWRDLAEMPQAVWPWIRFKFLCALRKWIEHRKCVMRGGCVEFVEYDFDKPVSPDQEKVAELREMENRINSLSPPLDGEALKMSAIGYDTAEIARAWGVSATCVRDRILRGRSNLLRKIKRDALIAGI